MIFFIFLYQRYIYRVDPTRVNEFGTSQEMFEQNGDAVRSIEEKQTEPIEQNGEAVKQKEESESQSKEADDKDMEELPPPKSPTEKKQD